MARIIGSFNEAASRVYRKFRVFRSFAEKCSDTLKMQTKLLKTLVIA